ncbi:MAG: ATP synthase F1 subunit epsilon [Lachnospiraceae bacterium]|nr:ATP synthase F1 subunit epsilon [Lachnospiraceae bacterium]
MAENKTFFLEVVTPNRVFFKGDCEMLELSTIEGDIGIYPEHVSTTCILVPGTMKIHQNGEIKKAALHTGFIEILRDRVTVLAEAAEWPGEINIKRAEEARKRAEERLARRESSLDVARAELALKRAVARINALK